MFHTVNPAHLAHPTHQACQTMFALGTPNSPLQHQFSYIVFFFCITSFDVVEVHFDDKQVSLFDRQMQRLSMVVRNVMFVDNITLL